MKNPNLKRTGFILSNIHTGSALKLWPTLAAHAAKQDGSFFIFPGGRLDPQPGSENLRNDIFSLASPENLDGVISWASSIGGRVSIEELNKFHEKFAGLPLVTIGQKIQSAPVVDFDAYSGMKDLVAHFVKEHGVRKIAFLRGPLNHTSAEDRFRGFKDAIAAAGFNLSDYEDLISSPFSWQNGEDAIKELCEDRELRPGKDFDALIASSDLMALSAVGWLESKGFETPADYLVGGFNDSVESQILATPFTTVHLPYDAIGLAAYKMIGEVYEDKKTSSEKTLATKLVIRESCGCNAVKSWEGEGVSSAAENVPDFADKIAKLFPEDTSIIFGRISKLFMQLFSKDRNSFLSQLKKDLTEYFENRGEPAKLYYVLRLVRNYNSLRNSDDQDIEKLLQSAEVLISEVQARVFAGENYVASKISAALSRLKNRLISAHDRKSLIHILSECLPEIGFHNAAVVLYSDDDFSRFIGGFASNGEISDEEIMFSRKMLLPAKCAGFCAKGVFVVQPLFMENEPLGYLITDCCGIQGIIYEDLRTTISSALQSIFLFEETNNAKQIAEQAEFAKTEFFANVGSDLCDPLKNLSAKVVQMESNVENGIVDREILSEQLLFLRSQIDAQLQKTETLVDLTRSQVNDLPMDKKLFDIRQILPGSVVASLEHEIPLLYGDAEKLKKAVQTIFDFSGNSLYIEEKISGICLTVNSEHIDWTKPEMLLAEKIILLQYGEIEKGEVHTEITFPWPNLAGLPPAKQNESPKKVLELSPLKSDDEKAIQIFGRSVEKLSKEDIDFAKQGEMHYALTWRPDDAPIDEWVKVYGLRHEEVLFRAPLICYSRNLIGHNFVEILEQKVRSQKSEPVLFVGTKYTKFGTWATDTNSVSISSMAEFDHILAEITPSLIVFEKIDEANIKKIRKNSKTVLVPILVIPDVVDSPEEVEMLCKHPRIILCNRGAAESEQFDTRIKEILAGDEILPPHTGAIVKKAILYLNKNASQQIVRWKLADTVHVSEDYLTRIFHKEIGLSLWEYLNRYRIYLATKMLLETNATIYEIAENTGFQDQAYFCRVFKKIYGVPPGKIRTKQ